MTTLKQNLIYLTLMGSLLGTTHAHGVETVGIRALQDGPLGNGFGFVVTPKTKVEVNYLSDRWEGRAKSDAILFDGDANQTTFAAGMVSPINDSTHFFLFSSQTSRDVAYTSNGILPYRWQETSQQRELGAGPVFRWGPIILGGAVSAVFFGERERDVTLQGDAYSQTLGDATVPFMRVIGGFQAEAFSAIVGLKVYNKTPVVEQTTGSGGIAFEEDRRVGQDGEIWVDSKFTVFQDFDLGVSITAITHQGSPGVQEDRTILERLGKAAWIKPENHSERRHTNSFHLGFGGRYHAQPGLTLNASLLYHEARYAKPEYGSLTLQNMGGKEINVGVSSAWEDYYLVAQGGYLAPESIRYTVDDQSLTPWAQSGDRITAEQPRWSVQLGFGVHY